MKQKLFLITTKVFHNFQIDKLKFTEVVHQNITDRYIKDNPLAKRDQIPGIDNNGSPKLQAYHVNCESFDRDSDTDKTLIFNMLKLEKENKTPVHSDYYQKKSPDNNPPEQN